jgi:hypothetical protein
LRELLCGPGNDIHLAAKRLCGVPRQPCDSLPVRVAKKKDVDVAARIFGPERVTPVDEREVDALLIRKRLPQKDGHPERALREFLKRAE